MGRGEEIRRIVEPSPCYSRGYELEVRMNETPSGYPPIFRGSSTLIPLVLGATAELGISELPLQGREIPYSPQIVSFLTEAQEWSKLECWIGIVRKAWPPRAGGMIKRILTVQCCFCSANDLVLPRSSSIGRNNGVNDAARTYPSRFNKSTGRHMGRPNETHRKFPFAFTGYVVSRGFHLFQDFIRRRRNWRTFPLIVAWRQQNLGVATVPYPLMFEWYGCSLIHSPHFTLSISSTSF